MQRKAAGGGETVEHSASANVARRRTIVFPLIEKDPGLLAMEEIGPKIQAVHLYRSGFGNLAREDCRLEWERFFGAYRRIVAGDDPGRLKDLLQALNDRIPGGV